MFDSLMKNIGWSFDESKISAAEKKEKELLSNQIVTTEIDNDASIVIDSAGKHIFSANFDVIFTEERDLILKYRELAEHPEIDFAINSIVNEAICIDDENNILNLNLDKLDFSEASKEKIQEEFHTILNLLDFNVNNAYEIFRRWYIDGRLFYQSITNPNKPTEGIKEIRQISPLFMKKVKEETKKMNKDGINVIENVEDYFIFSDDYVKGSYLNSTYSNYSSIFQMPQNLKFSKDSITYITSGIFDEHKNVIKSYLHKALKPINQLRMLEDHILIYRISRAPERRVIYVDVGKLPNTKAEQYVASIMNKFRNKMVYDASTGALRDSTKSMAMTEDFYLPRKDGSKGTEITNLPGASNLGELNDFSIFKEKVFRSLNIPYTRIASDNLFNLGRSSEITRDELLFSRFIDRLRYKFSMLFLDLLKKQLILKEIVTHEEWEETYEGNISIDFSKDSFFVELKEEEILQNRLNTLMSLDNYVGKYFSQAYVKKHILKQTDEQIEDMQKEMDKEKEEGLDNNSFGDTQNNDFWNNNGNFNYNDQNDEQNQDFWNQEKENDSNSNQFKENF